MLNFYKKILQEISCSVSWNVKKYQKKKLGVQLKEAQAGIKIAGRNINNLRYANDTTLMAESEEELKRLDESERGE